MYIQDFQYTSDYGVMFDVADGEHKVKILEAKDTMTKKGVPMIEVKLSVEESNGIAYIERIVSGEYFQRNMSRFFDAFKIVRGSFYFHSWRGRTARGIFKHQEQTFTSFDGTQKTVNKAVMTTLIVEEPEYHTAPATPQSTQPATSTTPNASRMSTPQQGAQNAAQNPPPAQNAAQQYGQSQQAASSPVNATQADFLEDYPF